MFKTKCSNIFPNFLRKYTSVYRSIQTEAPKLPETNHVPSKYTGLSYSKLRMIRAKNLPDVTSTYYRNPLAFSQGYMQWLYDINGRRYLDMFGGICTVSVGHSHPKITAALTEQMCQLGHCSNVYLHSPLHEYAEKLTSKLPCDLKVVYFVNSGSEANDLAVLLARAYTGNFDIVTLKNGYHGMTYQVMSMCKIGNYRYPVPQPSGVHAAMNADVYRGPWGGSNCRDSPIQTDRTCDCKKSECHAKDEYLGQLFEEFSYSVSKGHVAAFFAESIQGVGGVVQYPKGYLKGARQMVKENGGLFVADEVQTGFGRTGDHYWGFEMHDIVPDIVVMAKGIGNGFPLGAVVTTPEIGRALSKAVHFNTFGGNPLSSVVGKTVLEIIDDENLQENSKEIGTYLLLKLGKLRDKYEVVGDVRGKGLMIGIELVISKECKRPMLPEECMDIWEACKDMGLIIGKGGHFGNVFRIKPPMCITKEDADFTVAVLDRAFEMHSRKEEMQSKSLKTKQIKPVEKETESQKLKTQVIVTGL